MKDDRAPGNDHRVAGVVSPAEADHAVEAGREQVHELALALVPPLGSDDNEAGHAVSFATGSGEAYSRPSRPRTSSSSRPGVRSGLKPMWRVRITPSRSVM